MVFRSLYQSLSFGYASHIDSTIGNWLGKWLPSTELPARNWLWF